MHAVLHEMSRQAGGRVLWVDRLSVGGLLYEEGSQRKGQLVLLSWANY